MATVMRGGRAEIVTGFVAKRSARSEPSGDRFGPAHPLTFPEVKQALDLLSPESSAGVGVRSVAP